MAADLGENTADEGTAQGFVDQLAIFMDNPDFSDVVVETGSSRFRCHKVILAAASEFFRKAFSADMVESREGKVNLRGVSPEVFSELLQSIYAGKYILTEENLFDVWAAAHMLHIPFLLSQCEDYFRKTLTRDNCVRYCCGVSLFSETSRRMALACLAGAFAQLCRREEIRHLGVDEMKDLVGNDNLAIRAEHDVLQFVLSWAARQPASTSVSPFGRDDRDADGGSARNASLTKADGENPSALHERTQGNHATQPTSSQTWNLADMLECTRYLLVSKGFLLNNLSRHPWVKASVRCRALVEKISRYQAQLYLHTTWCPPPAVHRSNSDSLNVLLTLKTGPDRGVMLLHTKHLTARAMPLPVVGFNRSRASVFHYDNKIYVCDASGQMTVYSTEARMWTTTRVPGLKQPFCVIDDTIYSYIPRPGQNMVLARFPRFQRCTDETFTESPLQKIYLSPVSGMTCRNMTSVGNVLITFWALDRMDCYTIECFDVFRRTRSVLSEQLGSNSPLVTFRTDGEAFALQENGCLWRFPQPQRTDRLGIKPVHELVLWNQSVSLLGAVLLNNRLVVLADFEDDPWEIYEIPLSLAGVFDVVHTIRPSQEGGQRYVGLANAVLPKDQFAMDPHSSSSTSSSVSVC